MSATLQQPTSSASAGTALPVVPRAAATSYGEDVLPKRRPLAQRIQGLERAILNLHSIHAAEKTTSSQPQKEKLRMGSVSWVANIKAILEDRQKQGFFTKEQDIDVAQVIGESLIDLRQHFKGAKVDKIGNKIADTLTRDGYVEAKFVAKVVEELDLARQNLQTLKTKPDGPSHGTEIIGLTKALDNIFRMPKENRYRGGAISRVAHASPEKLRRAFADFHGKAFPEGEVSKARTLDSMIASLSDPKVKAGFEAKARNEIKTAAENLRAGSRYISQQLALKN